MSDFKIPELPSDDELGINEKELEEFLEDDRPELSEKEMAALLGDAPKPPPPPPAGEKPPKDPPKGPPKDTKKKPRRNPRSRQAPAVAGAVPRSWASSSCWPGSAVRTGTCRRRCPPTPPTRRSRRRGPWQTWSRSPGGPTRRVLLPTPRFAATSWSASPLWGWSPRCRPRRARSGGEGNCAPPPFGTS